MDALQICLDDFNFSRRVSVHFLIQFIGKFIQIHRLCQIKLSKRLHIGNIECISQVLESHQDLILAQREEPVAALVRQAFAEFLGELEELLVLALVCNLLLNGSLVIE